MGINWLDGDIVWLDGDVVWLVAIEAIEAIDRGSIFNMPLSLIQPGWDLAANQGTADNWNVVVPIIPASSLIPSTWDQRGQTPAD